MQQLPSLEPWLEISTVGPSATGYRHSLVKEDGNARALGLPKLKSYIRKAHEDAKKHLRDLAGPTLDPFGTFDPAENYPEALPLTTLKGYFGEALAGVFAEAYSAHGISSWQVPVFIFTRHDAAFNYLEKLRQTGLAPKAIPGQLGDDCVAFHLNGDDEVQGCLVCEAKCTAKHDTNLLADAHENASNDELRPISIWKLIEVLKSRDDTTSRRWTEILQKFFISPLIPGYERFDLVMYVCGQHPLKSDSWMSKTQVHAKYTGERKLHSVEAHMNDVDLLIKELYDAA